MTLSAQIGHIKPWT